MLLGRFSNLKTFQDVEIEKKLSIKEKRLIKEAQQKYKKAKEIRRLRQKSKYY